MVLSFEALDEILNCDQQLLSTALAAPPLRVGHPSEVLEVLYRRVLTDLFHTKIYGFSGLIFKINTRLQTWRPKRYVWPFSELKALKNIPLMAVRTLTVFARGILDPPPPSHLMAVQIG